MNIALLAEKAGIVATTIKGVACESVQMVLCPRKEAEILSQ